MDGGRPDGGARARGVCHPEPVIEPIALDDRGSFAWVCGDRLQRASSAIAVDGGVLVVDPVDVPGLDEALARLGPVRAVTQLLDRHRRDAREVAARLGASLVLPRILGGPGLDAAVPEVDERAVIDHRGWREALLWLPDRALLVTAEAVGAAPHYLASPGDPLGVHPVLRLAPPRGAFAGLEPGAIALGHGRPVSEGAAPALEAALATARSGLPRAWAGAALSVLRPRPARR